MADNSRSPDFCPWEPDEVCKAANGACLPPRKRFLAGLKQNGWLSSTPPYFLAVSGASCAPDELKLEVDLTETKPDGTDSATYKQGESKTVGDLVSVSFTRKRAFKRRKSLSVLADYRNSGKSLPPEFLEEVTQEKDRSNQGSIESLPSPNREQTNVDHYKNVVDAARAAAAEAAKAAEEAKSIALEKAEVAAKAAAIARAALEAVALAAEDQILECQPSEYGCSSCEQNMIGKELEGEFGSGHKVSPLPRLLLTKGDDCPSKKNCLNKRILNGSASFMGSKGDEKTQAGQSSIVTFDPVLDSMEDKDIQYGQNPTVDLITACADNPPFDKLEVAREKYNICTAACPMPPSFDDEKLARQLHRVMNSSPRISRSRACLEYCRKSETSPFPTDGCIQIRQLQAGGCTSSREKKQHHGDKLRVSRSNTGKTDIKIRSMTAINETLSMLQKATISQHCPSGSTRSFFVTSDEYKDTPGHKTDDPMQDDLNCTFVSLTHHAEASMGNGDANGSHKICSKAKGVTGHFYDIGTMGEDDDFTTIKSSRISRHRNFRSRKRTTGSIEASTESGNGTRLNGLLPTCADSESNIPSNVASEQTGSYLETSCFGDYGCSDESQDGIKVSGPKSTAVVDVNETPVKGTIQEKPCSSKSGRATRKFSHLSLCGERPKRSQKFLGVLANGSSERNRNFGKSLSSYWPSSTTS